MKNNASNNNNIKVKVNKKTLWFSSIRNFIKHWWCGNDNKTTYPDNSDINQNKSNINYSVKNATDKKVDYQQK